MRLRPISRAGLKLVSTVHSSPSLLSARWRRIEVAIAILAIAALLIASAMCQSRQDQLKKSLNSKGVIFANGDTHSLLSSDAGETWDVGSCVMLPDGVTLTDALVDEITAIRGVDCLCASYAIVPDGQFQKICNRYNLARLELEGTSLSHTDMQSVVHVKSLRSLNLGNTPIGDSEVSKIALLDNLRELRIGRTRVTIGGVRQLYRNKNLVLLDLQGITLSDDEATEIRGALPNTEILW